VLISVLNRDLRSVRDPGYSVPVEQIRDRTPKSRIIGIIEVINELRSFIIIKWRIYVIKYNIIMIIYLFLLWHRPELIIGMSGKSKFTTDDDVVEVDGPSPQVGKSTLEKRARVADENAKAAEIIKARICSSQRYRVQKHSALWQESSQSTKVEYKSSSYLSQPLNPSSPKVDRSMYNPWTYCKSYLSGCHYTMVVYILYG